MSPDLRRRTLLTSVAGLATAGLAGCGGSERPLGALPSPPPEPITDLDVLKVRVDDSVGLFGSAEDDDGRFDSSHDVVSTERDLDALRFNTDVPAAVDLREFVTGVDLDAHSVLLFQATVSSCHDYYLVRVAYGDGDLDAEFCRSLRPADVACDAVQESTVGYAIDLPLTDVDLGSFGWGTGRCDDVVGPVGVESEGGDRR